VKIIALDFDDCIFPNTADYDWNCSEYSLEQLELNLKILRRYINKQDIKIFITSSWYMLFDFYESEMSVVAKDDVKEKWKSLNDKKYYFAEERAYKLIIAYLNKNIIGISNGNRVKDIQRLDNGFNKIVALDDMDLNECNSDNVLYIETTGALTTPIMWKMHKFFNLIRD
jgi:hypothetical protein